MSLLLPLLAQYIAEDPADPFNHYGYAMELYKSAPDEATQMLQDLTISHADYLPSYYTLGTWLLDAERVEESILVFEKGIILATEQGNAKAISELKRALLNAQAEL